MSTKVIFYVMDVTDVVFSAFLIYHFFLKEKDSINVEHTILALF